MDLELIATSTMGLEAVVARELSALGFEPRNVEVGRTAFRGDERAVCLANLWLRTAGRVVVRVGAFSAADFGALFDQTTALPWEEWIPPTGAFPVSGRSHKSQLTSVPACQAVVKKAIVERLRRAHRVATLPETGPTVPVEISLLRDEATLWIDTSGVGLHRRGYRRLAAQAQLRETLAAGLILLSYWRADRPLIDPFCGTGTIAIEAAMIGRNIAPGLHRQFAAEQWPAIPPNLWAEAREEARGRILPALPERILGFDIDAQTLSLARYHAQQAGVAADIHFQQRAFADLTSSRAYGCLVTNPPYGERMGEPREMERLYRSMPVVLRRLKTWSHFILTAYPEFEAVVGQSADRRRKLYNGRIECTYYQFFGPKPPPEGQRGDFASEPEAEAETPPVAQEPLEGCAAEIAPEAIGEPAEAGWSDEVEPPVAPATSPRRPKPAPAKAAFGGLTEKDREQAELFRRRLEKRAHHLRRYPTRQGITCYRLYERDVPEIPLVVDRYEDCLHITEYERPHERTLAEQADWLDLMGRTAGETLGIAPANVFLKRRERLHAGAQYDRQSEAERTFEVQESGLRFEVNLSDYVDTGLFIDHRITRSMVRGEAAGKRFVNLFGYTGSFTVYAAAGGAASTTTVDLSNTYLDWARRNMALNGFTGREHHFERSDAAMFLARQPAVALYDLAVVDPPTFARSKDLPDWDVQRDHAPLLLALAHRMPAGGVIYFSTNSRRFKLAEAELAGLVLREISRQTVPPEFRNRRIHRCWRLVKAGG